MEEKKPVMMITDEIDAHVYHDGERVGARAMHGYLSPWMAHWKNTSYKSTTALVRNGCELIEVKEDNNSKQHDLLGGPDVGSYSSMHAEAIGDASGATRIDEGETGKSKKASFDSKSFLISSLSQKLNGRSPLQREEKSVFCEEDGKSGTQYSSGDDNVTPNKVGGYLPITSIQVAPPEIETLAKECQLLSRGVPMKFLCADDQKNLALSTLVHNDFVKSASDIVPTNGRDKGKTVMLSGGPREVYQSSYNCASQEHYTSTKCRSYSSLCIREKQMSSLLDPQRSSPSRLTRALESTKPKKTYGVSSLVAQVPHSVHDVKAAKIYTSIDSVEESTRGHPKISQTTQCFLLSRNTDVNLSNNGQFFRESMVPTKFKGNNYNEIHDLSQTPPTSDHTVECLKLETLGTSKKSEGRENIQASLSSPPESNTMDIDYLHENNLPGEVPSQSNKCSKDIQNSLTSQGTTISTRGKNLEKSVNIALPDINEELLNLASPMVVKETSSSRTHSLDVEQLFFQAKGHARSKSSSSSLGSDPNSRWVKRLKLCTLDSAHGTKSEKIGEPYSQVKLNDMFGKIMKDNKINLEAKTVYHAEGQKVSVPDLPPTVLSNDASSFTEAKESVEITLSHPWIQRWSHNSVACSKKRHEIVEHCDPKFLNTVPEEFQNKQFPSIAAMALMGKAMNCLNASKLTKKGSVIVWNTKRL